MSRASRVFLYAPNDAPSHSVAALHKVSFEIRSGGLARIPCELAPLEPASNPIEELVHPQGDAAVKKPLCDLIVEAEACAPHGEKRGTLTVELVVGRCRRSIRAYGPRTAAVQDGEVSISLPEPTDRIPLTWELAYGGTDDEVAAPLPTNIFEMLRARSGHPGRYPRNPHGRGYIVSGQDRKAFEMPQLEDPSDPLTRDRIIARSPNTWYRQPLPACWDMTSPVFFPRRTHAGADAWFPPPEDRRLPEIARGHLPSKYRSGQQDQSERNAKFLQLAAPGMSFPDIPPGTPFAMIGMHPTEQHQSFLMPELPQATWRVEGKQFAAELRPLTVHLKPTEQRVEILYGTRATLSRKFIKEVHRKVPAALSVEGEEFVECFMPTPALDILKELEAKQKRKGAA